MKITHGMLCVNLNADMGYVTIKFRMVGGYQYIYLLYCRC